MTGPTRVWYQQVPDPARVCFICEPRETPLPLVAGHSVCAEHHGSRGPCRTCGFLAPGALERRVLFDRYRW